MIGNPCWFCNTRDVSQRFPSDSRQVQDVNPLRGYSTLARHNKKSHLSVAFICWWRRLDRLGPSLALALRARCARPPRPSWRDVSPLRGYSTLARHNKKGHLSVAFICWWRRRVSNPRPQALRYGVYMLIPSLISSQATRRAGKT